ncbi:pyruvate dehydrogenase E1 component subunit beta [Striga asiatica]|uniref:Pyruvate dehydrogenase E1 component subunit beta n=1 Tax=Striga asiatica TaxID=4170 RepID=A0A5A7Q3F6_STRAF|nr:pyruvate dehydrogenase E1 component subunit beta [Striga asiatica]
MDDFRLGEEEVVDVPLLGEGFGGGSAMRLLLAAEGFGLDLAFLLVAEVQEALRFRSGLKNFSQSMSSARLCHFFISFFLRMSMVFDAGLGYVEEGGLRLIL